MSTVYAESEALRRRRRREVGGVAAGSSAPSRKRRELLHVFPDAKPVHAYMRVGTVPPSLSILEGEDAWFGMQELTVGEGQLAGELALISLQATLLPTNPEGVDIVGTIGDGASLAWGDDKGLQAAVVVGVDLPIEYGEWTSAPCYAPSLLGNASTFVSPQRSSPYIWSTSFPPGKVNGATLEKTEINRTLAPAAVPLSTGDRLGVALVLPRGTVNGLASPEFWLGLIDVQLLCARLDRANRYRTG